MLAGVRVAGGTGSLAGLDAEQNYRTANFNLTNDVEIVSTL